VGGQNDIAQRLIRFIGEPEQRIREDYLRILRFFRFWALYGHDADASGLALCCQLKDHLNQLSSERITKEMLKLLSATNPWPVLRLMHQNGFDPLTWGHETIQRNLDALSALETLWGPADLWVRLSVVTGKMPQRLTLSRSQKKNLYALWSPLDQRTIWHSVYAFGIPLTKGRMWMDAVHTLSAQPGPLDQALKMRQEDLSARTQAIQALDHQIYPEFTLTGRDVMALGISGPEVGRILNETKDWWIEHHATPTQQECLDYAALCARMHAPD
jgi:tRNA nucleotidyltransferase/poly(A) polymerase